MDNRKNCSSGAISPLSNNIFNIHFLLKESDYIFICEMWLCDLCFLNSENLICRSTDISKCLEGSLRLRDTRVDCIFFDTIKYYEISVYEILRVNCKFCFD